MIRLFFSLALLVSSSPLFAGVTCQFHVTSNGGMAPPMTGRVAVDGPKLRMAFGNTVIISADGGRTMQMLNPAAKTYSTIGASELLGAGMIKITGMHSSSKDLGAGGTVEGYPTRHLRANVSFDIQIESFGTTHVDMETESWNSDRLPAELANIFHLMSRTGDPSLDKALAGVDTHQKGIALKEVMTMKMSINGGAPVTITTTSTITDIRQQAIPASEFAVPAGYKQIKR